MQYGIQYAPDYVFADDYILFRQSNFNKTVKLFKRMCNLFQIWDRRCLNETNPRDVGVFSGHLDGITYIDSKNDARYLISNSKDQTIKLWDMRMFTPSGNTSPTSSRRRTRYYNRWDYRWDGVPKECKYPSNFK